VSLLILFLLLLVVESSVKFSDGVDNDLLLGFLLFSLVLSSSPLLLLSGESLESDLLGTLVLGTGGRREGILKEEEAETGISL